MSTVFFDWLSFFVFVGSVRQTVVAVAVVPASLHHGFRLAVRLAVFTSGLDGFIQHVCLLPELPENL